MVLWQIALLMVSSLTYADNSHTNHAKHNHSHPSSEAKTITTPSPVSTNQTPTDHSQHTTSEGLTEATVQLALAEQQAAIKSLIINFYEQGVTSEALSDSFESVSSLQTLNKTQFLAQFSPKGVLSIIPDLHFVIENIIQKDNMVVVLSKVKGTPKGSFLGKTYNGTRSFSVYAIDIHTIVGGKIQKTVHVEDWLSAIQQLSSEG